MILRIFLNIALALTAQAEEFKFRIENFEVRLELKAPPDKEMKLDVHINGKLRQTFSGLGRGLGVVKQKEKEESLFAADLDRDGTEEILLRTKLPPAGGGVWAFYWDREKKLFAHSLNENGDRYIPVPSGASVELAEGGELRISSNRNGKPKLYRWQGKRFLEK